MFFQWLYIVYLNYGWSVFSGYACFTFNKRSSFEQTSWTSFYASEKLVQEGKYLSPVVQPSKWIHSLLEYFTDSLIKMYHIIYFNHHNLMTNTDYRESYKHPL